MGGNYVHMRAKERGIPMIDAEESLIIEVRKADVSRGDPKSPGDCALARACKREQKEEGVIAAYFFRSCAWLEYADKMVRYTLPSSVQKEIVAFDRGTKFVPGTYQISKVPKSNTKAELKKNKRDPKRNIPKGSKIKRGLVHRTEGVRNVVDLRKTHEK
jgi:hypothetical protein